MCFTTFFIFLLPTILCFSIPKNYTEYIKNATSYIPNITDIEGKVKAYEKDFFLLYRKAIKPKEMLCDNIERNIKSMEDIKNKYASFDNMILGGTINNSDTKKFLELRGDILFGRRNIDIGINRLSKFKKYCFNTTSQLEKHLEEFRNKNKISKEQMLKNINRFLQMDNGL